MSTPTVFVHGLFGSFVDPDLTRGIPRALAPDLLGYGAHRDVPSASIDLHAQLAHVRAEARAAFGGERVAIVGHSIGGVVAMLYAAHFPDETAAVVSFEGNFTLGDAFWSSGIARASAEKVEAEIGGFARDPAAWLARSGLAATDERVAIAHRWLARQAPSTIQAMARSVVAVTEPESYLALVREVALRTPIHLVAAERSRAEWHVPDWVRAQAASEHVVPRAGHLAMLDDADATADVLAAIVRGLG